MDVSAIFCGEESAGAGSSPPQGKGGECAAGDPVIGNMSGDLHRRRKKKGGRKKREEEEEEVEEEQRMEEKEVLKEALVVEEVEEDTHSTLAKVLFLAGILGRAAQH